ncbi:FHA domain-containing protein [Arthrobacter sp. SAFR-044]|uniref:FHA domain-containing protein n=1 Tax=Arthrobacter sp. SAFR-044 TaxID=3387278 RepID=UPI003F7CB640
MTGASYIPGSWLGIVRRGTAVLLGPESPGALAGAVWELLGSDPEPHEVLAAVTSSSGGSLTRIPSFGILNFNGSLRVFLRGELDLAVEQPGGPVDLDGRDVTTWNERRFLVPGKCRLVIAGGGTGTPGQAAGRPGLPLVELPLGEGVVLLQSLTLGAPAGPAAVAAPAPADREEPTRTPAGVDGPFAVNSSGEVDGPADNEQALAPEAPTGGGETADDSSRWTATAMPAAPAVAVQQPDAIPRPVPAVQHLDPEATIAPGSIIDADGELLEETGAAESAGLGEQESELPGSGTTGATPTAAAAGRGEAAPAVDTTTSYDHLWDRTVMRNIEDAAVREDPDADSGHVVPQQQPALAAAEPLPALGTREDAPGGSSAESGATESGAPEVGPAPASPDDAAGPGTGPDDAAATPLRPASAGVLIDSVPWRTGGATPNPMPAPRLGSHAPVHEPAPFEAPEVAQDPLAHPPAPGQEPSFDPDHDGQTVMKSSLAGTAAGPAANPPAARQDAGGGPLVLARVCAQGHANPPTRAQCSVCGAALLPDAVQVARPRLGRMRLSTGDLLDLDQSMVIGRQPSVSRVQGGVMPRLVQVASPGGDISRSHVEVRLEGWHVMLCDLKATNGTVLVREGQPPRRLAQNEMAILLDGDIAELGDNISLRFEEIP